MTRITIDGSADEIERRVLDPNEVVSSTANPTWADEGATPRMILDDILQYMSGFVFVEVEPSLAAYCETIYPEIERQRAADHVARLMWGDDREPVSQGLLNEYPASPGSERFSLRWDGVWANTASRINPITVTPLAPVTLASRCKSNAKARSDANAQRKAQRIARRISRRHKK